MASKKPFFAITAIALGLTVLVVAVGGLFLVVRYGQSVRDRQPSLEGISATDLAAKGQQLVESGSPEKAEIYLEQALKLENDGGYRLQLAVVKYRLKKYEEALELYRVMSQSNQDVAFAYNGMGNIYRDMAEGDASQKESLTAKALASYQLAIVKDEKYLAAYSNQAQVLWNSGRENEALELLDKGINATGDSKLSELKNNLLSSR